MKVLVTGANGLLGTNVIQQLLESGYLVKGFLRNKDKFLLPPHEDLELAEGDILDTAALGKAINGCDHIIHCAAVTAQNLTHHFPYYQINVSGTQNIIDLAILHNIKRIVYISSANTLAHGTKRSPGNEKFPAKKRFTDSLYAQSKAEAEQKLLAVSDTIEVVIVNPSFMIGAYDSGYGSGSIIRMGYGKKVVFYPPGGKNFVNVSDAARGTIAALEKGKNGEAYLLAGNNLSYREFFTRVAVVQAKKPLLIKLPPLLLLTIGLAGTLLRRFSIKTAVSYTNMKILCTGNYYSGQKAVDELDMTFNPIESGIDDAIEWFTERGIIK